MRGLEGQGKGHLLVCGLSTGVNAPDKEKPFYRIPNVRGRAGQKPNLGKVEWGQSQKWYYGSSTSISVTSLRYSS